MSGPSSRKSIVIALIGAIATITVAVLGLVPVFFGGKQEAPPAPKEKLLVFFGGKQEARPTPKEEPRPQAVVAAPAKLPPIKVSYRPSKIVGQGMVAGLTNAGEGDRLKNVVVLVRSPGEGHERSYRVARAIRANDSISVGWKELDGWKLKPGDRLRVRVDGYDGCVESVVPRK